MDLADTKTTLSPLTRSEMPSATEVCPSAFPPGFSRIRCLNMCRRLWRYKRRQRCCTPGRRSVRTNLASCCSGKSLCSGRPWLNRDSPRACTGGCNPEAGHSNCRHQALATAGLWSWWTSDFQRVLLVGCLALKIVTIKSAIYHTFGGPSNQSTVKIKFSKILIGKNTQNVSDFL